MRPILVVADGVLLTSDFTAPIRIEDIEAVHTDTQSEDGKADLITVRLALKDGGGKPLPFASVAEAERFRLAIGKA